MKETYGKGRKVNKVQEKKKEKIQQQVHTITMYNQMMAITLNPLFGG